MSGTPDESVSRSGGPPDRPVRPADHRADGGSSQTDRAGRPGGVFVATGVAARRLARADRNEAARRARAAAVLYGLSVVVTICANLNRRLRTAPGTSAVALAAVRKAYERPWRRANAMRTAACLGALALLGDAGRRGAASRTR